MKIICLPQRARRSCAGLAAASLFALLLCGCTRYFSTDIAGYVKDQATGAGVVGATVRIYLSKPSAADADGYAAETTTTYYDTIPGYFDSKIMWQTDTPTFSTEGDSIPIWLGVTDPDFGSSLVSVSSILSGGQQDFVPDVPIQRTGFYATLTGALVSQSAPSQPQLLNDSRVGIDFNTTDASEPSNEPYVTYTSTVTSSSGSAVPAAFTIPNIRWTNSSPPASGIDNKQVLLWVTPPLTYNLAQPTTRVLVTIYSNPTPNSTVVAVP